MIPEDEYPKLLKAFRICGTVLILIFGTHALAMPLKISSFTKIFDSMVEGGADALPPLTKLLVNNQIPLVGLIALVMMGSLWGIWMSRRLSSLTYLAGSLTAFFALLHALLDLAINQPLITIITKFQG